MKGFLRLLKGILVILVVLTVLGAAVPGSMGNAFADGTQIQTVLDSSSTYNGEYDQLIAKYAQQEGVSAYQDILVAILRVESGGQGNDVMQSSESVGLDPGTLTPEESIKQGCIYFGKLVKMAQEQNCDVNTIIQAYNFGPGYISFVAKNGGKSSTELAEEFARVQSGGEKVTYTNAIALARNGGWRYAYGNMFYTDLVRQYC